MSFLLNPYRFGGGGAAAPDAPPAGYFAWYKADSLVASDTDPIGTWDDQSANGYDLVQATGTKQPLYIASWKNGQPALHFDGSNDNLVKAFGTTYTQANTIFIVIEAVANATSADPWMDGVSASNRHWFGNAGHLSGDPLSIWAGTDFIGAGAYTNEPDGAYPIAPAVMTGVYNGASSAVYKNGVLLASGNPGTQGCAGFTIGSRNDDARHYECKIAEIIAYNSALSAADRAQVEQYLINKYALLDFSFSFLERVATNVGARQAVASDGTNLYNVAGGSGNTQHTLYKRDLTGTLVTSRNTSSDGSGAHNQLSGIFPKDGKLYVTANDFDSAEGWPQTSPNGWVYVYNASDLSFDTYYSLGSKISEAITYWGGYWWEVNASAHEIRQFDGSFTLVNAHSLSGTDVGNPYWQAIMVIDDVFYLNPHGDTGPAQMQAYTWDGSGFDYVGEAFAQPTRSCSQGAHYDGTNVWWAERAGSPGNIVKSSGVVKP